MKVHYTKFRNMDIDDRVETLNELKKIYGNIENISIKGLGINKKTLEKYLKENNIYFNEKDESFYYKNIDKIIDNIIERLEILEANKLNKRQVNNNYNIITLKNKKLKTKTLKLDIEVEKKINELIGENGALAGEKIQDIINTALVEFINKF